jgi:phosphoglycolate phosphatase
MVAPRRVALIFDMDNTLIGSQIDFLAIRRALVALLRAAGAVLDADEVLMPLPLAQLAAIGSAHDCAHGTDLARRIWEIIEAHEATGLRNAPPLDKADEVLAALRARGFRIAILTNSGRAGALEALRLAGLIECAETIVARDDVRAMKPAGDGVGEAVRRLGDIKQAYVIGDSWIDGAAAAQAGALFIAYRRAAEDFKDRGIRPWRTIEHLSELLTLDFSA